MTQSLRSKKGVTLVELLAVIVILAIIAAIAVPTIGGLITRQRENAANATFDTVEAAAELFADGVATTVPFTLTSLDPDFVDLKNASNIYSFTAAATADDVIYIRVSAGGAVTFYNDAAGLVGTDVYINGFLVYST